MFPNPFHGFSVNAVESPECRKIRGQLRLSDRWVVLGKRTSNAEDPYSDFGTSFREPVDSDDLDKPAEPATSWIFVTARPGLLHSCPECGAACKPICYKERTLHHLPDMGNRCVIVARVPKIRCTFCNVTPMVPFPLAESRMTFTRMLARTVMGRLKHDTRTAVAESYGITTDVVDGILERQMRLALCEQDLSHVTGVYVDEIQFGHGQDYTSIFVDQDHNAIYACKGHGKDVLERFSEHLTMQGGDPGNVRVFSADMSAAYEAGVREQFPNARLVWDRFHLVKAMNDAVNDVRKREVRRAKDVPLSHVKYIVLRHTENMDGKQLERLKSIRLSCPDLALAFDMKEAFCRIIKTADPEQMGLRLLDWALWVMKEGPEEIVKKAERMLMKMELITNWGIHKVSNSVSEGINKKVQDTRRQAYGYRNVQNFFHMVLLRQGKLTYRF